MGVGGPRDALSFRGAEMAAQTQKPYERGQVRCMICSSFGLDTDERALSDVILT